MYMHAGTSPHHVSEEELGENGVLFVAVGMDGSNSPILGVRQITKPVPYRTGVCVYVCAQYTQDTHPSILY